MIRLFKVKEKQRENAENANGRAPGKKQSAGELRLHKGMLDSFYTVFLIFPLENSFTIWKYHIDFKFYENLYKSVSIILFVVEIRMYHH